MNSNDYLYDLGYPADVAARLQALTAPRVTKAKAALGKGEVAGGATTYAPGHSPRELAALLDRAKSGDQAAQAEWRAFAVAAPGQAGALIKAANATVTKGKRKPKAARYVKPKSNRGRTTTGQADNLADQAARWQREFGTPQPVPPVTKSARAADPALAHYAATHPAARALLLNGA